MLAVEDDDNHNLCEPRESVFLQHGQQYKADMKEYFSTFKDINDSRLIGCHDVPVSLIERSLKQKDVPGAFEFNQPKELEVMISRMQNEFMSPTEYLQGKLTL